MDTPEAARLHLELDLHFTDAAAVQEQARAWARDHAGSDPATLAGMLAQAEEGPDGALMLMVEPADVVSHVPGVTATGATLWIEGPDDADGGTSEEPWAGPGELDGFDGEAEGLDGLADPFAAADEDGEQSEDEWLQTIFEAGGKLTGVDLARLGYDAAEPDEQQRSRQLQEATLLRGALHWAYESYIDDLLTDVALLRESPDSLPETLQLAKLPPALAPDYGPLFAQRFLAVSFDAGHALASSFAAPSCTAQELALTLVLDQVETLRQLLPSLALAEDWRRTAEETLLGHGSAPDPRDVAAKDIAAWFEPYPGGTVNPYAAN